jgi:hypothetical protein
MAIESMNPHLLTLFESRSSAQKTFSLVFPLAEWL